MIKTVSVKYLRHNFGDVRDDLEKGIDFIVIYRSKPICELKSLGKNYSLNIKNKEKFENWPVFNIKVKKSAENLIRDERD